MSKREEDEPVKLHPLTFEETLKRMLNTPPVNPAKRKKKRGKAKNKKSVGKH